MSVYDTMAWAKRQSTGSVGRKAVLMALAERCGENHTCWPSQVLLAEETEQCERTVRSHLVALEEAGFISHARHYVTVDGRPLGRGKACNRYVLHVTTNRQDLPLERSTNRQSGHDQPAAAVAGEVPLLKFHELPCAFVESSTSAPPDRFADFWDAYPKRTDKIAAKVAWTKAIKLADPQVIIDAARRYRPPDPRYTKIPPTWLNHGCWEDEESGAQTQLSEWGYISQ